MYEAKQLSVEFFGVGVKPLRYVVRNGKKAVSFHTNKKDAEKTANKLNEAVAPKKKKKIEVILDGGIIQDIIGIPRDIVIEVRDYDVDTRDDEKLTKDAKGAVCHIVEWESLPE